jgi:type I restriction enzyme S subunit
MSDELPNGWIWAEMQDICSKVQDGTHFSPKEQSSVGDYKYITAKNIKSWGVDLTNVTYVSEKVHRPIYERCNPEKGDVLYIKDGATTGVATVNTLDEEFSLLSSVALFKPIQGVLLPNYLKWYLNSPSGFKAMTDQMTGSAITRLVLRTLRKSRIPIAPLLEQRRIVAKLETVLSKEDACQQRLAKISVLLKRFRQSVLAAACSGRLTTDWREENPFPINNGSNSPDGAPEVPDSWTWKLLSDIAQVKGGVTKGRRLAGKKIIVLPYLRVANVQDGYLDLSEMKEIEVLPEDKEKYHLEFGDILFTEGGDRDKLGRGTLWRGEIPDCIHQNHIFRGRLRSQDFSAEYVSVASKSEFSRRYFFENANQTVNLASINLTTLSALPLPLPPLPEQQEIVRRMEGLFALADRLELRLAKARGRVDQLTPSLLARAFAGKLVPQDPNDEPASKLLERLNRSRASRS